MRRSGILATHISTTVNSYTGPRHASVFTGAPPFFEHGIIGNNWYDPLLKKQGVLRAMSDRHLLAV